jgi:glutamate---cysteine ligase / carboxylate-amine ligase
VAPLDLDSAHEAFETSTDFTVGLEEEFALLEPGDLGLVQRFEDLRDAASAMGGPGGGAGQGGGGVGDPILAGSLAGELISSEIEIRSGRGQDLTAAFEAQRDHRRRLFTLAREKGVALGATGTHPWSDYRDQRIIDTEHYRRVEEGLKYVAWRNNTFSLHVHVGVRGADRAVLVCDRLRPVLPLLLAISANSPFLDGRDSGLHTARTQIFTKSFPRCGVPDAFGSWEAFARYIDFLVRTRSIVEYTQVWWSIRPHFAFGTVEVRICDAQMTASESEGLAALITACVAQAAREIDDGVRSEDIPGRLIEENVWRAIRYGLDGELLDLISGQPYPAAGALDRLLQWTAPVRTELGIEISLPQHNGAQRQRRMHAEGLSLAEVYAVTVGQTRDTYAGTLSATAQAIR